MQRRKVLFLIQSLGGGGAEKVLVNLVNNMDKTRYEITVMALFGGGVNEQYLAPHIHLKNVWKKTFPGNTVILKCFSPERLHTLFVKDEYDIEVAYLEGSAHRIVSGCRNPNTKIYAWQHSTPFSERRARLGYRSMREAQRYFGRFSRIVCVADTIRQRFLEWHPDLKNVTVVYNTNESEKILALSREPLDNDTFRDDELSIIGVGKITENKGFDRLAGIHARLRKEGIPVHTYILGEGEARPELQGLIDQLGIADSFTLLGYQTNPYKFVSKADLFVCSSHSEGFSTAATEALIVGTPVCSVEVSGMKEMLGNNNEYGFVTENDDEALYQGIRRLFIKPELLEYYRTQAHVRGNAFSTENTVAAVERLFEE